MVQGFIERGLEVYWRCTPPDDKSNHGLLWLNPFWEFFAARAESVLLVHRWNGDKPLQKKCQVMPYPTSENFAKKPQWKNRSNLICVSSEHDPKNILFIYLFKEIWQLIMKNLNITLFQFVDLWN